jgi:hypothetical protein
MTGVGWLSPGPRDDDPSGRRGGPRKIDGIIAAHESLLERIAWQIESRLAICWDNDGPVLVATVREGMLRGVIWVIDP